MPVLDDILQAIGDTPVVELNRIGSDLDHQLCVKCEFLNPSGSLKDRMAMRMCEAAADRGDLEPGGLIVENTSGNTGMALAMYAAVRGYECIFTIPDKMSQEKQNQLKAFGAEVEVCPYDVDPDDPRSYYSRAKTIAEEKGGFYPDQYNNLDNVDGHYLTLGPELHQQTGGELDHVFIGAGTGGSVSGVGKFFQNSRMDVNVVGIDPKGSVFYDLFHTGEMPEAEPYQVEGIGEDQPCDALQFEYVDDFVQVNDEESFLMTRRLAEEEGLYAGGSCGSTVSAMVDYMKEIDSDEPQTAVALLADHGSRYLSKIYNDEWMREHGYID